MSVDSVVTINPVGKYMEEAMIILIKAVEALEDIASALNSVALAIDDSIER